MRGPLSRDALCAITECDHEWSENISALLHVAGITEDDQASRLRAVALASSGGSHTIGLEVLRDGGRAVNITPTQVCIMAGNVPR